jgi:nucleotide-binding universal stress UspA family protein
MKARPTNHPGEVLLNINRRDEPLLESASRVPSPFQLKRILVPIDFSDCSRKALQYAIPLAKQYEGTLTLLSVVSPITPGLGDYAGLDLTTLEADLRSNEARRLAELYRVEVREEVPADRLVRVGSPALEIIRVAKQLPADLIVISTHGNTGIKHVLLGSVAEHVVRRAPCPVLVVREHEHEFLAQ